MGVIVCVNVSGADPSVAVGDHVDFPQNDDFCVLSNCLERGDDPVSSVLDHTANFSVIQLALCCQSRALADHTSAMRVGFGDS